MPHAMGKNATWYSNNVYKFPEGWQRKDFEKKYGKLSDGMGYKDLIPMFTAEKFDAEEWADLFAKAGAKFAGPVAEHHDGFAMWDTKYSDWNAAKMGPKRDIVGELSTAIKAKDMKYVTAFHHAASWFFFPVWDERYDCSNPEFSGLYGPIHEEGAEPSREFMDEWHGKIIEVIDKYEPEFIDEYKTLHSDSNQGVRDLLNEAHMHNFSIFLHRLDNGNYYEFGYYEYTGNDFEADMEKLNKHPRNIEWLKICDSMQIPLEGYEGWAEMEQVYYNK